jgi:hypothetical protein
MIEAVFHDVMAAEDDNLRVQYDCMWRIPFPRLNAAV